MFKFSDFKEGQLFSAIIYERQCNGQIQIENGKVFLCQNKIEGDNCNSKLGYKYSWVLPKPDKHNNINPSGEHVEGLKLTENPSFQRPKLFQAFGYNIERKKINRQNTEFIFGCGEVKVTKNELRNYVKTLKNKSIKDFLKVNNIIINRNLNINVANDVINQLISEKTK